MKLFFFKLILCLTAVLITMPTFADCGKNDFYAYYTKLNRGGSWEKYSRTSEYADIVVQLGESKLTFWRGTSYMPVWETSIGEWQFDEIVVRKGDGTAQMPDRTNTYSNVRIIENSPNKIIIHWRYLPVFSAGNPHTNVNPKNFVDEVFTIFPNGRVIREIMQGTQRIDDWNDPKNKTVQQLQLSKNGIKILETEEPQISHKNQVNPGNPIRTISDMNPVAEWNFDEARGDSVTEKISQIKSYIQGNTALWKKGISGTALAFDGYNSQIAFPAPKASVINGNSITLEAWFAIGAYPFNWAPLVQQGDSEGYFLGIDSHGYPGFKLKVGGKWQELTLPNKVPYNDKNHLELFKWYHIAGVYDKSESSMRLYIDGQQIAVKANVGTDGVEACAKNILIGKAGIGRIPTEALHDTYASDYGFDGLIDEIKIFNKALNAQQISTSFLTLNPESAIVNAPDLQKRQLPIINTGGKFGAIYIQLPYVETWDNLWRFSKYCDVVVGFDKLPIRYVFWRGVSYIPMISNADNQWYTNEFNEYYSDADYEPMSDKGSYDSHVRVIENTEARVVVEWRYRLTEPGHRWSNYNPETGWGDVSEMIYYIYPDGVATKRIRIWTTSDHEPEWDEPIVVLGEGKHPESVIGKTPFMSMIDSTGNATHYDWNPLPPKNPLYKGNEVQKIHFNSEYSPFSIQKFMDGDMYSGEVNWYSVFATFNHWPVSQINSSGRNATFSDRVVSVSLAHYFWMMYKKEKGDIPFQEKILMEGMTNKTDNELADLANSWLSAPEVRNVFGCKSLGYNKEQRAYVFSYDQQMMRFTINASNKTPIENICLVVKNWKSRNGIAKVKINGQVLRKNANFRQGIIIDSNDCYTKIIWIRMSAKINQQFEIAI